MQQTCVLVKPDGLQRGLIGEIITRFERKGLKLVGLKMTRLDGATLEQWYDHLKDKPFFGEITEFMTWTPIVAMVWEGLEVIPAVRKIVGITKAREAEAGSIRGDLGMSGQQNIIHASDSPEAAKKEIELIFSPEELHGYSSATEVLIYGKAER
jgi:nucleoside-diphosphate kinase